MIQGLPEDGLAFVEVATHRRVLATLAGKEEGDAGGGCCRVLRLNDALGNALDCAGGWFFALLFQELLAHGALRLGGDREPMVKMRPSDMAGVTEIGERGGIWRILLTCGLVQKNGIALDEFL